MEGSAEISDRILINRFYNLLYNEYDEYRDIFNEIGVDLGIATGEIRDEQVEKINVWIDGLDSSRVQDDEKIKLIELLEKFRKISDKDEEFKNQLEIVKDLYELIIGVLATKRIDYYLKKFNRDVFDYFCKTQKYALKIGEFRRDNIIHQLRVFLLGIYILYEDKDFWRQQFQEDIRVIINPKKFRELVGCEIGDINIAFKEVLIAWMIASLFHDFGRSIEDANEAIKNINETYELKLPGLEAWELPHVGCINIARCENMITFFKNYVSEDRISTFIGKKAKKFNHGPMSLFLFPFDETETIGPEFRDVEAFLATLNYSVFPLIIASYLAIALHSDLRCIFSTLLTQFLIFCDELQEWNRVTAIRDQNVRIFPCRKIYMKIETVDSIKNIRVVIPYEEPKDIVGQEIFSRFKPVDKWKDSKNKLEKAKQFALDRTRKNIGSLRLEMHILPTLKNLSNIITIKIDEDMLITYKEANIGDIILS
jgi:hypothetical protein